MRDVSQSLCGQLLTGMAFEVDTPFANIDIGEHCMTSATDFSDRRHRHRKLCYMNSTSCASYGRLCGWSYCFSTFLLEWRLLELISLLLQASCGHLWAWCARILWDLLSVSRDLSRLTHIDKIQNTDVGTSGLPKQTNTVLQAHQIRPFARYIWLCSRSHSCSDGYATTVLIFRQTQNA